MKKKRILISLISVTFLLLAASIVLSILRDDDPYRYFTGMGSSFDLSPNEEYYVFSYFVDGKEDIYRSTSEGTDVEKLTESASENFHSPRYSKDGTKILYLAENAEGINSLLVASQNGTGQEILTNATTHVSEAVFSNTGEEIYFFGTAAEDFKKAEGETTEGFDLFVVDIVSKEIKQLTNQDHFTMNYLSVSPDGKEIYYSLFDGNREVVTAFSLEDGSEKEAPGSTLLPDDTYSFRYSPDGKRIAYTSISKESLDSSLFKYELFLLDLENGQSKRLTNLDSSVVSPEFFKDQTQIAFLENSNWPQDPAEHTLKVIDLETEKIQSIELELPHGKSSHLLSKSIDIFANGSTVAILYVILLGLISTYLSFYHSRRRYYPSIASVLLTVLVFISSFIVAMVVDPWYGIALGMLAAALFGCTLIIFGYTFALTFFLKRRNT
ncbi:PD40 domain-containing protein [Lysinibacillus antri]|uniref:DUF5050 domain-containing protein n=1 Tax=Lysinibacillus antri TaxID=2498145 RepID=A0A3S0QQH8_9BACI|nr:PD40 domain-containing protein [Lysinibacillus antri]RUL54036.1 hypothetical protein EK386_07870 [Lysinibacillus antri]